MAGARDISPFHSVHAGPEAHKFSNPMGHLGFLIILSSRGLKAEHFSTPNLKVENGEALKSSSLQYVFLIRGVIK
jgi:hypothetical protein